MKREIEIRLERGYAMDLMNSLLYYEIMMRLRGIEVSPMYYGFVSKLYERLYGNRMECFDMKMQNYSPKESGNSKKRR